MIQCSECEFFNRDAMGRVSFSCDPFSTIKEPSCIAKLQLVREMENGQKLDRLVSAYESTLSIYRRLQPMQEKIMEHMEREISETEDADSWKFGLEDEDDDFDSPENR
ncbi:MAG: hypothetical protein H6819_11620 [Phycisphaerales bacterium]|nr:hypothetical protein [Phycisphaerales bacterium]MCB9856781.1 hypothetical protein [Phycisphaerales bacterium]MCB9862092.1 hypothetical protein [Phycisphaerales bacterium]